ncbi:MAG: VWA domain-containing protein [Lachnospiraceae bacterium]|nr:VWA domain-containing protein [Lachnospiraceae bacterium]
MIYLDLAEFSNWEKDNAKMYINFTNASKEENGGRDIFISTAESTQYNPKAVATKESQYLYSYTVSKEEEGATELRFWRGNDTTLWNCSVVLSYKEYAYGINCVKVTGWNNQGDLFVYTSKEELEKDSDGDGLPDCHEKILGSDKNKKDTDGDGLTDYEEYNLTKTNPTKEDTNGNSINDGEDDIEGDGLSNQKEIELGTNVFLADTDGDKLTDYEEIYTYKTNPLVEDTDEDSLTDYDDIQLNFNPLLKDTDKNGIIDSKEKIYQTITKSFDNMEQKGIKEVSVSLNTNGNIQENLAITDIYEVDYQSKDVVGLIGVPIEITYSQSFDTADIVFTYDEQELGDTKEEDLAILWYNEDENWYQILDEDCKIDKENNTVTYSTTHFSTYMLVDSTQWYQAWRQNIDYRNSQTGDTEKNYFDITFVVDVSGSMCGTSIQMAKTAMKNFISAMQQKDEAAIVTFHDTANTISDFTNDKPVLREKIDTLVANGGTNVNNGLLKALDLFQNHSSQKQKIVVLICDGDVNYVTSTITSYLARGIQIYAINLANESSHTALEQMAELTGGQYYYGNSSSELQNIYASVNEKTLNKIDPTDTDGDGLYDVYEKAGIKLPNGKIIYTNPNQADTDGDGLTDMQETGLIYNLDERYIGRGNFLGIKYFELKSDPTKKDTDEDGILDKEDAYPLIKDYVLIAELDNKYFTSDYLRIVDSSGVSTHGGNQGWWMDKVKYTSDTEEMDKIAKMKSDKYYRLAEMGCGVIAMSDAELFMKSQTDGYRSGSAQVNPVDEVTGITTKNNYRLYLENMYERTYTLDWTLDCYTGLNPWKMEEGFSTFLKTYQKPYKTVEWAEYALLPEKIQKELVIQQIEEMLDNGIPVVFSYCDLIEGIKIGLYSDMISARICGKTEGTNDHYMTIVGVYKYRDISTFEEEYILKVVSWGDIYYINYNKYAEKLSYVTNILSVY